MGFDTALFVQQPVGSHLICAICQDVQEKPTSVCDNGHVYCEKCIATWVQNSRGGGARCPDCRLSVHANRSLCRPLETVIMGMKVRCLHKDEEAESKENEAPARTIPQLFKRVRRESEEGKASSPSTTASCCEWTGTLEDYLKKHSVSECLFAKKTCDLCKELVKVTLLEHHKENVCPRRLVSCALCNTAVEAARKVDHERRSCPEKEVECRSCKGVFRRKDLGTVRFDSDSLNSRTYSGHMDVCPKLLVPCEFVGCGKYVKREDIDKHNKDNAELHAKQLNVALFQMQKKIQEGKSWEEVAFEWVVPRGRLQDIASSNGLVSTIFSQGPEERQCFFFIGLFASGARNNVKIKLFLDYPGDAPWIEHFSVSFGGENQCFCTPQMIGQKMMEEEAASEYFFIDEVEEVVHTYTAPLFSGDIPCTLNMLERHYALESADERKLTIKFSFKQRFLETVRCLPRPTSTPRETRI